MPCLPSIRAAVRLSLAGALILQTASAAACSTTPAEAVRAFEQGGSVEAAQGADGYRVAAMQTDTVLGRSWASVERCGHPDWPRISVPHERLPGRDRAMMASVSPSGAQVTPAHAEAHTGAVTVRAGQTVRLWRYEANLRLEMTAVSEESGTVGDRVRVRVAARPEEGSLPRTLVGLVRGPADVEME